MHAGCRADRTAMRGKRRRFACKNTSRGSSGGSGSSLRHGLAIVLDHDIRQAVAIELHIRLIEGRGILLCIIADDARFRVGTSPRRKVRKAAFA